MSSSRAPTENTYAEKLVKFIPAEITAAFLAGQTLISSNFDAHADPVPTMTLAIFACVLWALNPIFLRFAMAVIEWKTIAFSTLAFPLWAASAASVWYAGEQWVLWVGLALIVWTLFAPIFNVEPVQE